MRIYIRPQIDLQHKLSPRTSGSVEGFWPLQAALCRTLGARSRSLTNPGPAGADLFRLFEAQPAFFISKIRRMSFRSRALTQGRSQAFRFSILPQYWLHWSLANKTGSSCFCSSGGRMCRSFLANTDMDEPQRCSNTSRFVSGKRSDPWKPNNRTPGSVTKSCQRSHALRQEPHS